MNFLMQDVVGSTLSICSGRRDFQIKLQRCTNRSLLCNEWSSRYI